MSAMKERRVYKGVEPEPFRKIKHACSKLRAKVITERRFREWSREVFRVKAVDQARSRWCGLMVIILLLFGFLVQAQEADSTEDALAEIPKQESVALGDTTDLDPLLERIGEARYVLLGEASHGTSDYYLWRARISRRLIEEKGFSFVAVEGDWPDLYRVNEYVKNRPGSGRSAYDVLNAFERWPTWMWANWEVVAFVEWLRDYNDTLADADKVGFYGLDVYSLWASLDTVLIYVEREKPALLEVARRTQSCFKPYGEDEQAYARATLSGASCEAEATALLKALRSNREFEEPEAHFDAEQNAFAIVNAERYYRAVMEGGPKSWNVRDHHMVDTLDRLVAHHQPEAKAIVWEHNTHIGDARATTMAEQGMVNVGQLVRERHKGEGVVLVGFGSYRGSVVAARAWGAEMERMRVAEAQAASWEAVFHKAGRGDRLLILDDLKSSGAAFETRGHRAIGVTYNPEFESFNYVPTVLPRRYNVFVYLDKTEALHPLHMDPSGKGPPQLYPWGF
jgi:erythromycin esterase